MEDPQPYGMVTRLVFFVGLPTEEMGVSLTQLFLDQFLPTRLPHPVLVWGIVSS